MKSFHSRTHRPAAPRPTPAASRSGHSNERRADIVLVAQGLARSRQHARSLIEAGQVLGPEGVVSKPAQCLPIGATLRLRDAPEAADPIQDPK